jgi:hypothetical protein
MSTGTTTNPLLAEGRGVVIRDTKGWAEPVLGRVTDAGEVYMLVDICRADGKMVRFERASLYAMVPGEHERWKLTAPGAPGSEEYGDLLIRQARLQAERERVSRELDLIAAVLETADAGASTPESGESLPGIFANVHRLAGQVAGRISDEDVEARLRKATRTENDR